MKRTLLIGLGLFLLSSGPSYADRDAVERAIERIQPSRFADNGRLDIYARIPNRSTRLDRTRRLPDEGWQIPRGTKGRKYLRRFSYAGNLYGDKLLVYKALGFTPHRLGTNESFYRTERWKYHSLGVEFVFDVKSGELIDTRYFPAEPNHID